MAPLHTWGNWDRQPWPIPTTPLPAAVLDSVCWHNNWAPCPSPHLLPGTTGQAAGTTTRRASVRRDAGLEADKEEEGELCCEGELRARRCVLQG